MVVEANITIDQLYKIIICFREIMQFQTLALQMSEEVLTAGIIITVCLPGMRNSNAMIIQTSYVHLICILESPI